MPHDCVIIAISVVAMEFGSEVEMSKLLFDIVQFDTGQLCVCAVLFSLNILKIINPKDMLIFHSD